METNLATNSSVLEGNKEPTCQADPISPRQIKDPLDPLNLVFTITPYWMRIPKDSIVNRIRRFLYKTLTVSDGLRR